MPTLPLLLTTDDLVLDEVLRVAGAAGTDLFACDTGPDAASRWASAPLVLAGADTLARISSLGWPRRSDVIVVARDRADDDSSVWRGAVAIGAEHVVVLPEGERWLVDRLGDLRDSTAPPASVVTVVPGRGGAGASTYALLLARAHAGESVLIDADALSGGIDMRAEAEATPGVRWPDLAAVSGRLSAAALRGALPIDRRTAVVSSAGADPQPIPVEAFAAVLDASVRGGGLVVIDAPRTLDPVSRLSWSRSDVVVVVASDDPTSIPATCALADAVVSAGSRAVAVVRRGRDGGVHPDDLAARVGLPVVAQWRHDRGLARGDLSGLSRARHWRSITDPVLEIVTAGRIA